MYGHLGARPKISHKNVIKALLYCCSMRRWLTRGMRTFWWEKGTAACNSRFLAAKSILKGKDYEEMAKKYFGDKLKASMVNRYLWENFGRIDIQQLSETAQ